MPPENLTVDVLFPVKLATIDFSQHTEEAAQVVNKIVRDTNKDELREPKMWAGKLTTNFLNRSRFLPQPINDALESAIRSMLQVFLPEGVKVSGFSYEYWFNHYSYGEYQEVHDHIGNLVSGVWFLKGDPSNLHFYNASPASQVDPSVSWYQGDVGSICMFPSTLPHFVKEDQSGERITIAYNVRDFTTEESFSQF